MTTCSVDMIFFHGCPSYWLTLPFFRIAHLRVLSRLLRSWHGKPLRRPQGRKLKAPQRLWANQPPRPRHLQRSQKWPTKLCTKVERSHQVVRVEWDMAQVPLWPSSNFAKLDQEKECWLRKVLLGVFNVFRLILLLGEIFVCWMSFLITVQGKTSMVCFWKPGKRVRGLQTICIYFPWSSLHASLRY